MNIINTKYMLAALAVSLCACDSFNEMSGVKEIAPLEQVKVALDVDVEGLTDILELKIKFDNYTENLHFTRDLLASRAATLDDLKNVSLSDILPGIYTVTVAGRALDVGDNEYYISGNLVNHPIHEGDFSLDILIQGLKVSPLIFKEIYFCGSRPPTPGVYFRDQFYEIYNNSAQVQYLDGVYFANLTPGKSTTQLPVWPEQDGNNYCYAERVWRFPGSGTDYPLQPGESCVISQFAANHQLEIYNPNCPVNGSSSEFEFCMNNPSFPDQPAFNMEHVFYDGRAEMGSMPQYLTSVFGGAYVIFRPDKADNWDPVNDPNMSTGDLSKPNSKTLYAKIPIKYVLDAVEAIDNETKANAKRVPGVLDAGMTWVGASYCGLGVARYIMKDDSGNDVKREEYDCYIYQDTNNSTEDFERGVVPQIRRNGAKMPSWNHTLQ